MGTYITDNRELKSDKMHNWLASRGTSQLFAAPYTLAHNGHVECMHCTLMAKARTMHIYIKCPPNMWDESYLTATYHKAPKFVKAILSSELNGMKMVK